MKKDKFTFEVFLLYVLDERGLRRGPRDYFALKEEDIVEIAAKINTLKQTGDMEFNIKDEALDEGLEETTSRKETYKLFADTEDFERWWNRKGCSSGVPKPKTSSEMNEGMSSLCNYVCDI